MITTNLSISRIPGSSGQQGPDPFPHDGSEAVPFVRRAQYDVRQSDRRKDVLLVGRGHMVCKSPFHFLDSPPTLCDIPPDAAILHHRKRTSEKDTKGSHSQQFLIMKGEDPFQDDVGLRLKAF